jgi:ABC-type multidrug transport system ATPase subunit
MDSGSQVVIAAGGISKRFGAQRVLSSLSLEGRAGEVTLLLGANGAGKSTLLRILAGLSKPDAGVIKGKDRLKIGYVGHYSALYGALSVGENLRLFARLAGISQEVLSERIEAWGLTPVVARAVRDLSRGNLSRVAILRALIAEPDLLLLDEPSSNLDDQGTLTLVNAMNARRAAGGGVIVATHDIARLAAVATRVVVIGGGGLVADSGHAAERGVLDGVIARYREVNR